VTCRFAGSGAERAGRGPDPGQGGAVGARHRGRGNARRRLQDRGADPARGSGMTSARRSTRWPAPRRSSPPPTCPRTDGRLPSRVRWTRPPEGSGPTAAPTGSCSCPWSCACRKSRPRYATR